MVRINIARIRKSLIIIIVVPAVSIICFFSCCYITVQAEEETAFDQEIIIDEQVESGEIKSIESQLERYASKEIEEIFEGYDPENIIKDAAKGRFELNIKGLLGRTLYFLFKEVYLNINVLLKLLVLVVLCAVLKNLQASFLSESVGELAFFVCYIVIVSILFVSFTSAVKLGTSVIENMVDFMYATVPVLITLLVAGGNFTSGGVFQPILVTMVEITAIIFKNVLLPVIFMSAVLSIIDNISDKIQLSKLANLLRQSSMWAMGFILTIFIAVVSVQGSLGAVADGVAGKTAKFAIGFLPVVGGYLSDAADTVIGCTLLIKNAAGFATMIGVIAICIVPLLKILALIALYKITCVLVEPISDKKVTKCINDVANSMTFILGIVVSVTFMFLISITAIISASNTSTMIR
jgi:stage III sporulation protein AE